MHQKVVVRAVECPQVEREAQVKVQGSGNRAPRKELIATVLKQRKSSASANRTLASAERQRQSPSRRPRLRVRAREPPSRDHLQER